MAEATVAVEQVAMGVVEARAVVGEGSPLQPLPCRRRLHHPQRPKRMPPPPPPLHPWPMSLDAASTLWPCVRARSTLRTAAFLSDAPN
jgi:hypothetical protein